MLPKHVTNSKLKSIIIISSWLVAAEKLVEMGINLAQVINIRIDNKPIAYEMATLKSQIDAVRLAIQKATIDA